MLLLSVISSSPNLANRLFHLNIEGFFSLHFKTLSLVGAQYLFCDPVITATMCARAMMACPVGLYAGPALMAVWSKAPPLTARCLSPLPGFKSRPGYLRKLLVTLGWAVIFAGYSVFLHYLQLASHELATIGINVTKNKIPNSKLQA